MKHINEEKRFYQNDIEDFSLNNIYVTKTEREMMIDKYMRLKKVSFGCHVRLGFSPQYLW